MTDEEVIAKYANKKNEMLVRRVKPGNKKDGELYRLDYSAKDGKYRMMPLRRGNR